jgi:hypothetical protein
MPTILRIGPYRFFFYSNERGEPAHIHVQRDRAIAKFWLEPIQLAGSKRFAAHELTELHHHVEQNIVLLLEA